MPRYCGCTDPLPAIYVAGAEGLACSVCNGAGCGLCNTDGVAPEPGIEVSLPPEQQRPGYKRA